MGEAVIRQSGTSAEWVIEVSGSMTVQCAAEIRDALIEAFDTGARVVCDLGGVEEIDTAGLQLLCSAHLTSLANSKSFAIVKLKDELERNVLARSGFIRHIGCKQDDNKTCLWIGGE